MKSSGIGRKTNMVPAGKGQGPYLVELNDFGDDDADIA